VTGLPAGLSAALSGSTITLSGTPTATGTFNNIQVSVQDATAASASGTFSITINPPVSRPVQPGQTAGIGFWHNKNGQALLLALDGGPSSTQLGNWLAATLPNMYGANAGSNDLAGKSNAAIAALFQRDFALKGPNPDAQVLATALSVYVTNATLDPTKVAAQYGFTVSGAGVDTATFNVGKNGAAFGVAKNKTLTGMDLVLATNKQSVNGVLYNGDRTLRNEANDLFDALNQAGAIR